MRFKFFFIFCLYIKNATSSQLMVFRGEWYNSDIDVHNFSDHKLRQLLCISDNPIDAIVWNTNLDWSTPSFNDNDKLNLEVSELSNQPNGIGLCGNNNSQNCFSHWEQHNANWSLMHSFDVPMGPVFDSRFEHFVEYKASRNHQPIKTFLNGINSTLVFEETGALVFSIRGEYTAQLMLCKTQNVLKDFCYWLIIGGWKNSLTVFRKCENGIPVGFAISGSNCSIMRSSLKHVKEMHPLNPYEWKTFTLTWEQKNSTLKLYDPNKLILSYTDHDYVSSLNDTKSYHILFRSPEKDMLFRFHNYSYTLATQPNATLHSPPLIIRNNESKEICINILVGLCRNCKLGVNLIDGLGKRHLIKIIFPSEVYEHVEHNLSMWQHDRIKAFNESGYSAPIKLEFIALSSETLNEVGNHWAIAKLEECLPKDTVKRIKMFANQDFDHNYYWPTLTCQRLSYDKSHSEVVNTTHEVSNPPDDLQYCTNFSIGPHCATSCGSYFITFGCRSVTLCTKNRCFCPQGYTGDECQDKCRRQSYGYGCTNQCYNCKDKKCNPYTGVCQLGCQEFEDQFFISPYCNIGIDTPSPPYFNEIGKLNVRAFSYGNDNYNQLNATISFEIISNYSDSQLQTAQRSFKNVNGTIEGIYYVIFTGLRPGIEYSAKMIINIDYGPNKHKDIHGKMASFVTLCNWDENFEIIPKERSLLIKKILEQDVYSCPDFWYSIQLSAIHSHTNKSVPININHIDKKFPITLSNLMPYTKYKICIKGANNKYVYCQRASTLESGPSEVVSLNVNSVGTTEAEIYWLQPVLPNGILRGYNLTIEILYYKGCNSRRNIPIHLITSKSYTKIPPNDEISYKITKLLPFVTYKVTVIAYNSKLGAESILRFDTEAQEIPTATFENLNYEKNMITWTNPADCWTITGPIKGAKVVFHGSSANVKNFYDQHDTRWHSFTLNVTKIQKIYGNECYRVQIYVLHKINGTINETAYSEIYFTTDPSPPPKVKNLEIVEIDNERNTTTLRWQKLSPPTNGEIIYYTVGFRGENEKLSNVFAVFPDEECYLWKDFICKTLTHPLDKKQYIEVKAYNKGVYDPGKVTVINDSREEVPAKEPKILKMDDSGLGRIHLKWQHPHITGGPLKKFIIHLKIISSQLEQNPYTHDIQIIEFPISKYEIEYNTHINLLPSTFYNISVQGIGKTKSGKIASAEMQTNSSLAFAYEPYPVLDYIDLRINITIPPVINNTRNSILHIVVKGPSICKQGGTVQPALRKTIGIDANKVPWRVAKFPTHKTANLTFTIGDELIYDGVSNCALKAGNSYIIVIIVCMQQYNSNEIPVFTWRSQEIQIGPVSNKHYELWAIPVGVLVVIIALIPFFYLKKDSKR